jgi:multicomponent Na+:H+ antiporter subunit B
VKKTDILDVTARKLAPFMFLFGFYLVSYGHLSPGGGFQGGVVIASGVILLALARDVSLIDAITPLRGVSVTETLAFVLLLTAGLGGAVVGRGFLGDFFTHSAAAERVPHAGFILLLNLLIGIKVGAGVSMICIYFFREARE